MIQRNAGAGQISCVRKKFAQSAPVPSPLRAGGSASADHGVRQIGRAAHAGFIALTRDY